MTIETNNAERWTGDGLDRAGWTAAGAGVLGALAMTFCCILPLVLVSLGVTGVFIGQVTAHYACKWVQRRSAARSFTLA